MTHAIVGVHSWWALCQTLALVLGLVVSAQATCLVVGAGEALWQAGHTFFSARCLVIFIEPHRALAHTLPIVFPNVVIKRQPCIACCAIYMTGAFVAET